jgi:hypothetical protein
LEQMPRNANLWGEVLLQLILSIPCLNRLFPILRGLVITQKLGHELSSSSRPSFFSSSCRYSSRFCKHCFVVIVAIFQLIKLLWLQSMFAERDRLVTQLCFLFGQVARQCC